MNLVDVIKEPLVTEKLTTLGEEHNQYGFVIDKRANKIQVKQAIEKKFDVTVTSVRTMNVTGKMKRMGRYVGRQSSWKKAIVSLKDGDKITLFEGV